MSTPAPTPEPLLVSIWIRLRNRIVNRGFVWYELVLARLCRTPKLCILFSNVKGPDTTIRRSFRFTPHEIHFGEFRPETVRDFDVLVPLLFVNAVRRLDEMRALIGHSRLPIPSRRAIDTCDDKLAFHQRMTAAGLGEFLPRVDDALVPPYVLKGRSGHAGKTVHLVLDDAARDLPADESPGDYFRQELVPGRYEYSVHILFIGGRIRRALCIEHDMAREISVKGSLKPRRQRIVRCRHLRLFERILTALEFKGLRNIDFKLRDGKPLVVEVNPRMGISLRPYFFAFVRSLPRGRRVR